MKRKDFKKRLHLQKKTISNLGQKELKGGTNPIGIPVDVTVGFTTLVTIPRICETKGDVCTMHCETNDMCT